MLWLRSAFVSQIANFGAFRATGSKDYIGSCIVKNKILQETLEEHGKSLLESPQYQVMIENLLILKDAKVKLFTDQKRQMGRQPINFVDAIAIVRMIFGVQRG